jgi:hypothetical protein
LSGDFTEDEEGIMSAGKIRFANYSPSKHDAFKNKFIVKVGVREVKYCKDNQLIYSHGFYPCQAVVAKLKNGGVLLYHALMPSIPLDLKGQNLFQKYKKVIKSIYIFQKDKSVNANNYKKAQILKKEFKKNAFNNITIKPVNNYTGIVIYDGTIILTSSTIKYLKCTVDRYVSKNGLIKSYRKPVINTKKITKLKKHGINNKQKISTSSVFFTAKEKKISRNSLVRINEKQKCTL